MDVILHIGAHRTATTTFQHYMRGQSSELARAGIGFWGPARTRGGLFHGLFAKDGVSEQEHRRVAGRIALNLAKSRDKGRRALIISEENLSGSVRDNLRRNALYPGIGPRLARVHDAFGGQVTQVVLTIRSLDLYWASALGFGLTRGRSVPDVNTLDRLVTAPRSWRDVITDVACASGDIRIWVFPFEAFCGQPETQLAMMTGTRPPTGEARAWLNRTPDLTELRAEVDNPSALPSGPGRWRPFSTDQAAALREAYADDILWLASGAGGVATSPGRPGDSGVTSAAWAALAPEPMNRTPTIVSPGVTMPTRRKSWAGVSLWITGRPPRCRRRGGRRS